MSTSLLPEVEECDPVREVADVVRSQRNRSSALLGQRILRSHGCEATAAADGRTRISPQARTLPIAEESVRPIPADANQRAGSCKHDSDHDGVDVSTAAVRLRAAVEPPAEPDHRRPTPGRGLIAIGLSYVVPARSHNSGTRRPPRTGGRLCAHCGCPARPVQCPAVPTPTASMGLNR